MRIMTVSEISPFGESQTRTQRQKRWPMPSRRHRNHETVGCPMKFNNNRCSFFNNLAVVKTIKSQNHHNITISDKSETPMRIMTVSQISPFGESQTRTQRQKRWPMPSRRHRNHETVRCPIKRILSSISSRSFEKAIARTGGCYE
jgi:hypothetical protein